LADNFNWDVVIQLATKGAKGSIDDLNRVSDAQDRLNREGKITEKGLQQNTQAINRYSQATAQGAKTNQGYAQSLNSVRYANYDVAQTMFTLAAGITAVGVATAAAFGSQEAAFTEVERIVEGSSNQIGALRAELTALSTEIPRTFQDLSGIASLGAALNIPAESLASFSEVVAKFASTTGVSLDAAATGFGRLAQYLKIPQEEYENLGSAILRAGNISVATEEQVLKFSQALALPAARAGLATDQVVALGAAIASFGNINVEGAGSALNRIFTNIDRSVQEGGKSLENFATVSNKTAAEFGLTWKSDAGGTFNDVLKGLAGDVSNLSLNLDALGVRNVRDRRVIEALVINYQAYRNILGDTSAAWREGTYMSEAYGLVLDDLNTKWGTFINAITNAAAAVGSQIAPALKSLLDISTTLLVQFAGFVSSPLGQYFVTLAGVVAGLVATFAALRGGLALTTAAWLALNAAGVGGIGLRAGVMGLASAMGIYTAATVGGAAATWNLSAAMKAFGRATVILAVLGAVVAALMDVGSTAMWAGDVLAGLGSFLEGASVLPAFKNGAKQIREAGEALNGWGKQNRNATEETYGLNNAVYEGTEVFGDLDEELDQSALSMGNVGGAAAGAAAEVRTLTDYATDLASIWSRAFEIRFSGQSTLDTITSSFISMQEAAEESARTIRSLKADIAGLNSDLNIQKYFLSIAVEYGDTARAEAIQANIAKLQEELADKTAQVTEEQSKNSKTLTGNSKAAIANRTTITGLVQQYQAHVQALAASGLSSDELARRTEELRQDFINQATTLGFTRAEVEKYAVAFDDVKVAIQGIPRNITVTADANPALQALNEFRARAQNAIGGGINVPITSNADVSGVIKQLEAEIALREGRAAAARAERLFAAAAEQDAAISALRGKLSQVRGYATGGFTGQGPKYAPAGIVHRGEYVVPKEQVNQRTGLPYADSLGRLQKGSPGRSGYAGGGFVQGRGLGRQTVDLSAMSIQQIGQVMEKFIVVDGKIVAQTASSQYATQTAQGAF
jgi:TP901 family phage tail tape measure protein